MADKKKDEQQYYGTNFGPASAEELSHIMQYAWEARQPLLIVGAPGIGKTAIINKWSVENGFGDPICLVGSQMEPPDVTGLPHAAQGEVVQATTAGNVYGRELESAIRDGRISEEEAYERVSIYFTDYLVPTSMDVPNLVAKMHVEEYPGGPYGAKGAGELPLVAPPAAYLEAVEMALGGMKKHRLNAIPFSTEDVILELNKEVL